MTGYLGASSAKDQIKRRVLVNQCAAFHELEIELGGTASCAIDALVLWMQPVSELRRI